MDSWRDEDWTGKTLVRLSEKRKGWRKYHCVGHSRKPDHIRVQRVRSDGGLTVRVECLPRDGFFVLV